MEERGVTCLLGARHGVNFSVGDMIVGGLEYSSLIRRLRPSSIYDLTQSFSFSAVVGSSARIMNDIWDLSGKKIYLRITTALLDHFGTNLSSKVLSSGAHLVQ